MPYVLLTGMKIRLFSVKMRYECVKLRIKNIRFHMNSNDDLLTEWVTILTRKLFNSFQSVALNAIKRLPVNFARTTLDFNQSYTKGELRFLGLIWKKLKKRKIK